MSGLPKFVTMSKLSNDDKDSERYKALGFKAQFDGAPAGLPWAELIEELSFIVSHNFRFPLWC